MWSDATTTSTGAARDRSTSTVTIPLLVQKRFGFGWTLNFGNPRALLLLALIVGLPLALPLIFR